MICLLLMSISFSQSKRDTTFVKKEFFVKGIIDKNLSNYQLKVENVDLLVNNEYYYTIYNFILLDTLKSDTLSVSSMEQIQGLENETYEFTDINFDGYNDLKILWGYSANGLNYYYRILLFNKSAYKFEYNEVLSEIIGTNCEIDSVKKEISFNTLSFVGGRPDSYSAIYKFKNNKLIMVSEYNFYFIDSTDTGTGKDLYREIIRGLKDSSLVIIKDEIIKYNYGEE
ncbi:MAG: hypothetical protein IT276_12470 [Ignavibacteriaceae bacterium]|nr:hypothetical protein [Ignavibacteriaceae bacterium]